MTRNQEMMPETKETKRCQKPKIAKVTSTAKLG